METAPKMIDFDRQFQTYLHQWIQDNQDQYLTPEAMEAVIPDVYQAWLEIPAPWLDGATPQGYFWRFEDATLLVDLLGQYLAAGVGVPDPLADRITSLGDRAEESLLELLRNQSSGNEESRMYAINLLNEIGSVKAMNEYIAIITAWQSKDLADAAADALSAMDAAVVEDILAALEQPMDAEAAECLVDVLSNYPGDKRIFRWLSRIFVTSASKALFASDLGKFGDSDAVPLLKQYLHSHEINYLDYIEINNAIEQLGGDPDPTDRDFTGDPYYESMKGIHEHADNHHA